ncbi:hypothetical protein C5167_009319 [Papaver somniferum]|uniref:Uncharacterized protein n=1 Tax=Papaver somniferum TaxID=3469 RepID=A0A4Y7K053_PAPSO|nr:hypothetical protein C5167_009319 [Papaver somniferum]
MEPGARPCSECPKCGSNKRKRKEKIYKISLPDTLKNDFCFTCTCGNEYSIGKRSSPIKCKGSDGAESIVNELSIGVFRSKHPFRCTCEKLYNICFFRL